jgi:peptide/nickel transport system permease protein
MGIVGAISQRLIPTWIALAVTFALSILFKRKLGLYGKLFDSPIGMIGLGLVLFWIFTAIFGAGFDWIATHDPLTQVSGMKNKHPGILCAAQQRQITPIICWAVIRLRATSLAGPSSAAAS